MEKKYRDKYGNFVHKQRKKEEEILDICQEILKNSRNELGISMHFLCSPLSELRPVLSEETSVIGTDGKQLFVSPAWLIPVFMNQKILLNRLYLHQLLHCLFCHLWGRKDRNRKLWDLASDIAVENMIDDLYAKPAYIRPGSFRREIYRKWKAQYGILTAERIYRILETLPEEKTERLIQEFRKDDHHFWKNTEEKSGMASPKKHWEDKRKKLQTEMELMSKEASREAPTLMEQLRAQNRKRYDYREFLRRFSVLKEEMQVDMDTFDYIYYHYGMEHYGNLPLIEPLETKETRKIEDFVIVVDTSMSCKGELIQKFLEETYCVLSGSESFFRKIQVHIIQCDDRIREDVVIHNQEEMEQYLQDFTIKGFGGTDFRPTFQYVEQLIKTGAFQKLRGLLYFTDGYGVFPGRMPPYDTVFVFMKEDYRDVDVPPWAMKLILGEEDLIQEIQQEHPSVSE